MQNKKGQIAYPDSYGKFLASNSIYGKFSILSLNKSYQRINLSFQKKKKSSVGKKIVASAAEIIQNL